jgi:hypothetical protein
MTQKIFDTDNAEDMALLWSILPDRVNIIKGKNNCALMLFSDKESIMNLYPNILNIDFQDKSEITRPIPEATEADIGKLCYFWNYDEHYKNRTGSFGKLCIIDEHRRDNAKYQGQNIGWFFHCHRLTKQEIEELV